MPIDYSKWKDIEVSDDEDDTHPNIDTPSLFKWRHEARVQRMEDLENKKKEAQQLKKKAVDDLKMLKEKAKATDDSGELESIKKSIKEIEDMAKEAKKKTEEVEKEERLRPWNVDTISKAGFSKTTINKPLPRQDENITEEEKEKRMKEFVQNNKQDLKSFGWLSKYDDSKAFMLERPHLACEDAANFLVIECLNLAMEDKMAAMEQVAHQCICIQYLLELAKQLEVDPRSCISSFFTKIQIADPEYKKAFEDELVAFKKRIRKRAEEKLEEYEREERLGPGGLDPLEVMETLPKELQKCFETADVGLLQRTIAAMPPMEARYHMKRCVDSGLWKPAEDDPNTNPEDGFKKVETDDDGEEDAKTSQEPVYESVDSQGASSAGEAAKKRVKEDHRCVWKMQPQCSNPDSRSVKNSDCFRDYSDN